MIRVAVERIVANSWQTRQTADDEVEAAVFRTAWADVVVDKARGEMVIGTDKVKEAVGRFYQLTGQPPARMLVRPGFEESTAVTVRGLGLKGTKVEAGTRGILAGEMWME